MKKIMIFAGLVALIGATFGSVINSAAWYHQPKTPSMLVK